MSSSPRYTSHAFIAISVLSNSPLKGEVGGETVGEIVGETGVGASAGASVGGGGTGAVVGSRFTRHAI